IEVNEQRYCHILDPRTGWPAQHWQSVSVVAPVCVAAGACATVAMLMPRDEALAFLREQGVAFLAVDAAGEVWRSG
ncbi:MAG: FAD:protein FMN transferase, partial [Burkholderiaceae bacterium]|nr:FAD:protein FMN transferase [Burkholderiaceae bacterium]